MSSLHALLDIKKRFPDTLKENLGNVTKACDKLGICRKTYYNWYNADIDFKEACREAEEYIGDMVETKLLKAINDDNITAIIFYCKTKLRHRGYVEYKEIEQSDKPIQYIVTPADNTIFKSHWEKEVEQEVQKRLKAELMKAELVNVEPHSPELISTEKQVELIE
jgi:hypothetical protein